MRRSKMMFLESHKVVSSVRTHTNRAQERPEKDPFMCASRCEEDWEHRTHHYYHNTILLRHRGGGREGQSNLSKTQRTHPLVHTRGGVRIKWLREHKQLNIQCRISRQYVNGILSVLMKD